MKDRVQIVAVGYGSEFALDALCDALDARGASCMRIDMYDTGWQGRHQPPVDGQEVVLLSSQHPIIGRGFFARHHHIASGVMNLSDTLHFFKPKRSLLFPHDLTHPFHDEEVVPLREVTAVLVPDERFWYLKRWAPVHVVGWPKLIGRAIPAEDASGIVLMPTDVAVFMRREPEFFCTVFSGTLRPGVRFKLPDFPGTEGIRDILVGAGCEEIPASTSSAEVIATHATVVSNGLSSIVSEAAVVGSDVICVECGIQSAVDQWRAFSSYPNVEFVKPALLGEALLSAGRGRRYPAQLHPLDIDLVVSLVAGETIRSPRVRSAPRV